MLFQECLCFIVGKASRNMVKIVRDKVSPYGLTPTQFFLLIALYEENGILITALAKKVALDKSTLTSLLDHLERNELIQRSAHPTDRRIIQIYLTPKAEAMREDLIRIYHEINGLFLSRLAPEELKIFEGIINKLEIGKQESEEEI
ncbi:MAG: MarR family transcriptional regulator [Thermodesulfobacteriota bacterium]|nr:MarR family transcriptional regulator [Thermodesulfobacteriota bacterium]